MLVEMPPGAIRYLEVFITLLFSGYLMLVAGPNGAWFIVQHPASSIRISGRKYIININRNKI